MIKCLEHLTKISARFINNHLILLIRILVTEGLAPSSANDTFVSLIVQQEYPLLVHQLVIQEILLTVQEIIVRADRQRNDLIYGDLSQII